MNIEFLEHFLGILIGSSLAISGSVIQGVIRNPLASPDVIGITKGQV